MSAAPRPDNWSKLGVTASALCAVHCAALPLLAGASVVDHWHNPWLEGALVGVAAVVGYGTLGASVRRHGRWAPLVVLTLGLALVLGAHWGLPPAFFLPASLCGAGLLVAAQLLNRACPVPSCPHGDHPHSHDSSAGAG